MTIKLYRISGSPFAWRVHLALEHKKAPYELVTLSAADGELKGADFLKVNPRGKVPGMTDGDFSLWESAAMVEYIEDSFPDGPPLFPQDVKARATVRRMVNEVDNYVGPRHIDLALELFFKPPEKWIAPNVERGREGMLAEIEAFESRILGDFLAGDRITAADFALYPFFAAFARFELRKDDIGLTKAIGPKLAAWKSRVEALPYFDETFPPHWKG